MFLAGNAFAGEVLVGSRGTESGGAPQQRSAPIKIAVFDFELEDFSAAGTTVPGLMETKYLLEATEEAKRMLAESGRYSIVNTAGADLAAAQERGLRNCGGCDAAIAAKLGADEDMIGVVTKISMTEYTVTVQVSDARTGAVIETFTTESPHGCQFLLGTRRRVAHDEARTRIA